MEFARQGCGVVNADELNHKVLQRKEIVELLVSWWGRDILDADGQISRQAVSEIILVNPEQLKRLTDIVHPVIYDLQTEQIDHYNKDENIKAVILDVPLLMEVGWQGICDFLVYIDASEAVRHERLKNNRGWSEKKIKNLENLQISLDIKAKISEYTVDSNSCISNLASQVGVILSRILKNSENC